MNAVACSALSALQDWQKVHATPDLLHGWLANGFQKAGVGILTRDFPAVDIDVLDAAIALRLLQWCVENLGATLHRVGKAPKVLLAFRTDEPFYKIQSKTYNSPSGDTHKVEILGIGQQYVAYAEHPDTKKPYVWQCDTSLLDVNPDDLPIITAAQANEFVAYFESIIPKDWTVVAAEGLGLLIGTVCTACDVVLSKLRLCDVIRTAKFIG